MKEGFRGKGGGWEREVRRSYVIREDRGVPRRWMRIRWLMIHVKAYPRATLSIQAQIGGKKTSVQVRRACNSATPGDMEGEWVELLTLMSTDIRCQR